MIFGVLDRYIGRSIVSSILMTLFTLIALDGVIKFVEQLKRVGEAQYDLLSVMIYTIALLPKDMEIFFPMAALLGALLGLGALATRSEIVVMQAAGFSRVQISLAVMKTALPLMFIAMAIGEYVAPQAEQFARNFRSEKLYGRDVLSDQGSIWAKDGNDFIFISTVQSSDQLIGINTYHFNDTHQLQAIRSARSADYSRESKEWILKNVQIVDLSNPLVVQQENKPELSWKSTLTPDKLGVVALDSNSLSMRDLYDFIQYLKEAGQETRVYELAFWKKVASPLAVAVMMLMALSFIFGPLRSVPMGVRIITGVGFGFLFYVTNELFGRIGLVFAVPSILSALLPSILFLIVSLYLLLKRR